MEIVQLNQKSYGGIDRKSFDKKPLINTISNVLAAELSRFCLRLS